MIYIIHNTELNHLKIGYSKNPYSRLHSIQTGNSCKLEILDIIFGTIEDEQHIHNKLEEYKIRGEWYEYDKVILYINYLININKKKRFPTIYYNKLNEYRIPKILNKNIAFREIENILKTLDNIYTIYSSKLSLIKPYYKELIETLELKGCIYYKINNYGEKELIIRDLNNLKFIYKYINQYFKTINLIKKLTYDNSQRFKL